MFTIFCGRELHKMAEIKKFLTAKIQWVLSLLLEPITGYTRIVSFAKLAFLSLAGLLVVVLVLVHMLGSSEKDYKIDFSYKSIETEDASSTKMIKPRFQGVDKNAQPFNITADNAVQVDDNTINLNAINSDITDKKGKWYSLSSSTGTYHIKDKKLDLIGAVNLFSDDGNEFKTEKAHINVEKNSAYGNNPVEGQGPLGTIKANSFKIDGDNSTVIFNGDVKLTVYPKG